MDMTQKAVLIVNVYYDEESHMFVATSDDIPGLATEARDFEDLKRRVCEVAPELLSLNGCPKITPDGFLAYHMSHYQSFGESACA